MDVAKLSIKLRSILHSIKRGNYDVSQDFEVYLNEQRHPKEVVEFAEQLNFMSLKSEAREMALNKTINELAKTNNELKKSIENSEFISVFLPANFYLQSFIRLLFH